MPDESDELKKLKEDFALALEVLRCVLRKVQGIQTTEAELKRANEIMSALLEEYEVPPRPINALCIAWQTFDNLCAAFLKTRRVF